MDALSRVDETETVLLMTASKPIPLFLETLKRENGELDDLRLLHAKYEAGTLSSDYMVRDGILYFRQKYFIGSNSVLKLVLIREYHETLAAGNAGVKRTLVRLSSLFYWQGMRKEVEKFVAACLP